jgi:hypothetical protein
MPRDRITGLRTDVPDGGFVAVDVSFMVILLS